MLHWLYPQDTLSPADLKRGLRWMQWDGVCSQVMGSLTGGPFLVAFALLLGASNAVIGILAAIGPSAQLLHIPVILLVERVRLRRLLVVSAASVSRLLWVPVALVPWFVPPAARVPTLVICLMLHFSIGAIVGCAWNSWIRDVVPDAIRGSYFGRRLAIATTVGAVVSLAAAVAADGLKARGVDPLGIYGVIIGSGTVAGLLGVVCLSRIPEPRMPPPTHDKLRTILAEPFRDANFRQLLKFLGLWGFAVNLAAPFFAVYMLKQLGLPLSLVLGLSIASQLTNALFFGIWGRLADRYSNKSVLAVSGPLFILSIALWPFTSMPATHVLTIPLLVLIHVLAGISTAGVNLCTGNIALELAPAGRATAFLAVNALVTGTVAALAPIIGGLTADALRGREFSLVLRWQSLDHIGRALEMQTLELSGLDFVFVAGVLIGIYAIHRLLAVREEGEVEEAIVITELYTEVRRVVRHVSNVAGLRRLSYFPWFRLTDISRRWRSPDRPD